MVNIECIFLTISTTAPTHLPSQPRAISLNYGEFIGAVFRGLFKNFHL